MDQRWELLGDFEAEEGVDEDEVVWLDLGRQSPGDSSCFPQALCEQDVLDQIRKHSNEE